MTSTATASTAAEDSTPNKKDNKNQQVVKSRRGPSVYVHRGVGGGPQGGRERQEPPSLVPAFVLLSVFSAVYIQLQRKGFLAVPSSNGTAFLEEHPLFTGFLALVGVANMFNHVAGYLQPVPMWSLFTGAFIDFISSAAYAMLYYWIDYTPIWLIVAWIFQMVIHSYYMSTGLSKPEASAAAFASLMAHMRKLQTNTKDWWNTLFLYFDMIFHCIFLLEVIPATTPILLGVDVVLSAVLYSFLYNRAVDSSVINIHNKRPILYIDMKSKELRCPCPVCQHTAPFVLGCRQWFASIDQLYLDCWGIYEDDGKKQTKTLMERVRREEEMIEGTTTEIQEDEDNTTTIGGSGAGAGAGGEQERPSLRRYRQRSSLHVVY